MNKYNTSGSDDAGCLNTGFAKRILSKTSLKSSSSSGRSAAAARAEEISKLHSEIDRLKQNVEALKITIDNKDSAIGTLAREKEKLYVELKKVQRTNRNIHQQLEDERDFYQKEKEHYCREISSIKRALQKDGRPSYETSRLIELQNEVDSLRESLESRDKTVYSLCVKYLKLKSNKAILRNKMEKMRAQHNQAYDHILSLLDSSRSELDKLIGDKIQSPTTSPSSKKYLNIVKRNGRLHYENTQLKIRLIALSTTKSPRDFDQHTNGTHKTSRAKAKRSKSDGKVTEMKNQQKTMAKVKKKSIYTHSQVDDGPQFCNPRLVDTNDPNGFVAMFEHPTTEVRRPSSNP